MTGVIQLCISTIVLFIMYRYLLDTIGTAQLGVWAVVLASVSVGRLSELGFSGAVLKFIARDISNNNHASARKIVQTAVITVAIIFFVLVGIGYQLIINLLSWSLPESEYIIAVKILPWSIVALWIGIISGVLQSAIDGCQRMDLKNIILILCNLLYLFLTLYFVPYYGIEGVAIAQLIQFLVLMILNWFVLKKLMSKLPIIPLCWDRESFIKIYRYALNFQVIGISGLMFDPITKFLLAKFAGLDATAYYEMANQAVVKIRAIVVVVMQALLPEIATIKNNDVERLKSVYKSSFNSIFVIGLPYYLAVFVFFSMLSILWIGYAESEFILYGKILAVGALVSGMCLPAYFMNLGAGDISVNAWAHVLMSLLNLMLGYVLGLYYEGIGIVYASIIALSVGNLMLLFKVQKWLNIKLFELFSPDCIKIGFSSIVSLSVSFLGSYYFVDIGGYLFSLISMLLYVSMFVIMLFVFYPRKILIDILLLKVSFFKGI
ncbi:hypothetical protein GCM10007941_29550 [Amphritea balenae]|nr:hypothetical protein GCM10007941_29550 [Amphritea balenae]